ncbi:uncharacterized protein LOC132706155 [Cylas formicarius]|uniref:uncharacterized protein LOC132706155 n=1 Tax=Cylas formicarius TaxID=197179 RepID=UPI0029588E94|nr:uncharacterized protein LOC132706155 [Cylas formicarius]
MKSTVSSSIERLVRFSKFCCLLPPYDFRKKRVVHSFLCSLSALLHVVLPSGSLVLFFRAILAAPKNNVDDRIIFWGYIGTKVIAVVAVLVTVIQTRANTLLWEEFLEETSNVKLMSSSSYHSHVDRQNLIMILLAAFPVILYYVVFWGSTDFRYALIGWYCFYYQSLSIVVLINFIEIVLYKCREMNYKLARIRQPIRFKALTSQKTYDRLSGTVGKINRLFGPHILMVFISSMIRLLAYHNKLVGVVVNEWNIPRGLSMVSLIAGALVQPLAVCYYCDLVTRETRKTKLICFKLQLESTGDEEELQCLISLLNNNPITFSASGYFVIDRSTMSSLLTIVGTYFVAILQIRNGL